MTVKTITPKIWIGKKKHGEIFRLQQFMAERSIKPEDIQRDTGVTVRTITNSIYEEKPIGIKLLRELHSKYGVSIDWIVSGIGTMFISDTKVADQNIDYSATSQRTERVIEFIQEWMADANEDEKAWLETELKLVIKRTQ